MLFNKSFLPSLTYLSLLSLSLLSGLGILNSPPTLAVEKDRDRNEGELLAQTARKNHLPNGTYLYGSYPQPEEIGQEYMVFRVHQGEVKGAVYMPRSEFSCFTGTFEGNQMRMSIIDPYDGTPYQYAVALQVPPTASTNGPLPEIELEGYYRLDAISDNEQKILARCS
ncbi:hypothetical protein [Crocosphaera sp.]|uniref:hypothetical protein n=1 Tax=Crocosphaera sp. TaxID=2729996 RepID=UPI003F271113|nr:hypothetical protein [Crocosphaera sp.]